MTAKVVLTNRATPPDAILREVWLRTGDRPFTRIEDVIDRPPVPVKHTKPAPIQKTKITDKEYEAVMKEADYKEGPF